MTVFPLWNCILELCYISIIDAGLEDIDNPSRHFVNHGVVAIIGSEESM